MGVYVGLGIKKKNTKVDDKSKAKIAELEKKIKTLEDIENKFKESQVELVKENESLKAKIAELEATKTSEK